MADAGGIISDTGRVPVAQELVRPEQTQNGSVPGQHTGSNGGQVGSADQQAATLHSNGKPDQPSNSKGGILDTLKGPRSGIHWGAGVQSSLCCTCKQLVSGKASVRAMPVLRSADHVF